MRRRPRRRPRASIAIAARPLLAGCATLGTYMPVVEQFGVYKLDINQGNYLSQDKVDKLKVGQTKQQVRAILGTPLIVSTFRPNRWDYVYEFKRQGRPLEHRNFAVYFVDDKLARWEGDEMPPSMAELNREASAKALPPRAVGRATRASSPGSGTSSASDADAHRDRRRRRADGTGADRGDARRPRSGAGRRARHARRARRSGAMPASASGAPPASSSAATSTPPCAPPTC